MPWRECSVMEERLRFVARLLDGESMSEVCREFGISRKTGYKIFNRYQAEGAYALCDRSRRPVRYANQLPEQVERLIVDFKRDKPHWGARKIRELLVRKLAGDVRIPARSTVHAVLEAPAFPRMLERIGSIRNSIVGGALGAAGGAFLDLGNPGLGTAGGAAAGGTAARTIGALGDRATVRAAERAGAVAAGLRPMTPSARARAFGSASPSAAALTLVESFRRDDDRAAYDGRGGEPPGSVPSVSPRSLRSNPTNPETAGVSGVRL